MDEVRCTKCQTPVPPYLYAVNYYTSAVIWVNEHAKNLPCAQCGADVREGNSKMPAKNTSASAKSGNE